jgi:hypothetical protein
MKTWWWKIFNYTVNILPLQAVSKSEISRLNLCQLLVFRTASAIFCYCSELLTSVNVVLETYRQVWDLRQQYTWASKDRPHWRQCMLAVPRQISVFVRVVAPSRPAFLDWPALPTDVSTFLWRSFPNRRQSHCCKCYVDLTKHRLDLVNKNNDVILMCMESLTILVLFCYEYERTAICYRSTAIVAIFASSARCRRLCSKRKKYLRL